MRGSLRFDVEVSSVQQLTALREKLASELEDQDTTIHLAASSLTDTPYEVIGVIKGKPDERFSETIYAQDPDEAAAKAIKQDDKRNVVAVDGKVLS